MIYKRFIFYPVIAILIIGISCQRTVTTPYQPDAQVSFIGVSAQMQSALSGGKGVYPIFIDLPDTSLQSIPFSDNSLPYSFTNVYQNVGYFNKDNNYQFPTTSYNASQQASWIRYMRLTPGSHVFSLLDTAHNVRHRDTVDMAQNMPISVYYGDSLGYFRSWVLKDTLVSDAEKIRLRFLDASPDAGNVFVKVNDRPTPAGFPDSLKYGMVSSFTDYNNPVSDTLRIYFYHVGDSTNILARSFLQAEPGRSYTLTLAGYVNSNIGYTDSVSGTHLTGSIGLHVIVNKNY